MLVSSLSNSLDRSLRKAESQINRVLVGSHELGELIQLCCEVLQETTGASFVRIWIANEREEALELRASSGFPIDFNGPLRKIRFGQWRIGKVAATQAADFGSAALGSVAMRRDGGFACLPISCQGRCLGVLAIGGCTMTSSSCADQWVQLAAMIGLAIDRLLQGARWAESNQRLQAVLKVNEIGTWFWDTESQRLKSDSNANRLLNIDDRDDPDWRKILQHIHADDRVLVQQRVQQAMQRPQSFRICFRSPFAVAHVDSEYRWLELMGSSHFTANGVLIALPCVLLDISEQKRNEALLQNAMREVESSNKARGEFIANISHEVRTPLTMILGNAAILSESELSIEQQQQLASVRSNGEFLLQLLNDILDLSVIDANVVTVQVEPVDVRKLVRELHAGLLPGCVNKRIDFNLKLAQDFPNLVRVDPVRLRQVLLNLVGNAIKFTECGAVTLEAILDPSHEKIVVSVHDTGIGIPEAWLGQIFEPFAQVGSNRSRAYGGAGLGLAICQKLVEAMHGSLNVESVVGEGSTFTLSLPFQAIEAEECAASNQSLYNPALKPTASTRLTGRVLVVDDRRDIQMIVEHYLSETGIEVFSASSGGNAIEVFKAAQQSQIAFDGILLDLHMPAMDGIEAYRELRYHGYSGAVIAMTASGPGERMNSLLQQGFASILAKPIDPQQLIACVSKFVNPREY